MTAHGTDQDSAPSTSPRANSSGGRARQIASGLVASLPGAAPTAAREVKSPGAALVRVASRLGVPVEKLIEEIPADTVRRTRYPVREIPQRDGTTLYEHDLGIVEGRRASVKQ